jgi:gamma-glutamyltranspeptidase/glutathione hydrolase
MRGAIAAGHPLTAEAGAWALAEGGNAVDACVAAAAVSWVTESPLTGPGAGGFMLVHRARDGHDLLLDFFVAVPGLGLERAPGAEMEVVDVPFGVGETTQRFLIGPPSCAVPGTVAGIAEAHRLFGSLPWPLLLEPAIELARRGLELTPAQAFVHGLLDAVLRHQPEGRRVYGESGPLRAGDRLAMPDLAKTLEHLAAEGADLYYRGELAEAIVSACRAGGGTLTREDLTAYRVVRRRPVRAAYRDHQLVSNPPPSSGGVLIAFALRLLDRLGVGGTPGSAEAIARLAEVARETARLRDGRFAADLFRGGLAGRLLADDRVAAAVAEILARSVGAPVNEPAGLPSTTHISVLDARGNAASLSASTGVGSGFVIPGTGIYLNNMLGEPDLNPAGGVPRPGRRLTSMMAPSILLRDGRPRLVLGSAGSERLRGAIVQVLVNVVDHGIDLQAAIERPRSHLDGAYLHLEGGTDDAAAARLAERGYSLERWPGPDRNLYFGGVSAVGIHADGTLRAAGDLRRGGAGVVVR